MRTFSFFAQDSWGTFVYRWGHDDFLEFNIESCHSHLIIWFLCCLKTNYKPNLGWDWLPVNLLGRFICFCSLQLICWVASYVFVGQPCWIIWKFDTENFSFLAQHAHSFFHNFDGNAEPSQLTVKGPDPGNHNTIIR